MLRNAITYIMLSVGKLSVAIVFMINAVVPWNDLNSQIFFTQAENG
jgi:hypothetical protein